MLSLASSHGMKYLVSALIGLRAETLSKQGSFGLSEEEASDTEEM